MCCVQRVFLNNVLQERLQIKIEIIGCLNAPRHDMYEHITARTNSQIHETKRVRTLVS